jgi:hypothetical protein
MKKTLVMEAIQRIYPSYYGGYIDKTPEFSWGNIQLESGDASLIDKDLVEEKISEIAIAFALKELRLQRNFKLKETDWMAMADRTMSAEQTAYRQALRDLPANSPNATLDENGNLTGVNWPVKPE